MRAICGACIAVLGVLALASCTENGGSIYSNIQKATKTDTNTGVPTDATISDIVTEGSDNPANPYYVAAGKVYNGTAPSNGSLTWSAISVPNASGKDMLCNTLAYDSVHKKLWGGFYSADGSTFGLYSAAAGGDFSSSTAVTDAAIAGKQITHLTAIDGDVFAVTASSSGSAFAYALNVLPSGASSWSTLVPSLTTAIAGIGFLGTTYFVASGSTLYIVSGTSPIGPSPGAWTLSASSCPTSSSDVLQGVFIDAAYTSGSIIIVPASNPGVSPQTGNLYYSTNGGTVWTHHSEQASGYNVGFVSVGGPVDSGHTTYLLGTDSGTGGAFGFYSLIPSSESLSRFGGSSYSLYYSAVRRILIDLSNTVAAMGTTNNGLWVTTSIDSTGSFSGNSWSH